MRYPLMLVLIALSTVAVAQEPPTSETLSETAEQKRHQRMLTLAKSYQLSVDGKPVALNEQPLFSWSTPERQAIGGEMFVWTLAGRPLATIGIWTYDDLKDSHELQSLATGPISATASAASAGPAGPGWAPRVGGLVFKRLETEQTPHGTAIRRQVQMRNLLRRHFAAEVTTRESQQVVKLRLLPQPLYRYQPLPEKVIDGAMFAFAMGTDPEVLVLLEAQEEDTSNAWHYAFAPATSLEARGFLDGKQVWDNDDQAANQTFVFRYNR